ncbi:putative disease resistance protein At4g10780 isoform X2 [Phaseolus vulgaris]|uniref:Uncharacterized protein n=1 Tax=Phaseolus vulgaris TaxID=3885 RepID=V7C6Y4_PHAVU|nr:hypothetical protein PHAVU_003G002500g [Phaseolus vulgaris]ESW25040.1 hypothetical protein PHAVU_003G002500g [Phaseolus vulgaris]
MECLLGFASSISRDLVCGILNQLRYPCCYNNFVKKLEEEEEGDLIVTRDSVQKFVTNSKRQTKKTSEVIDKWLQDAINDVDNVNKLLKEARTKNICCFGHCPNWTWRYRVGKKLANKIVYLEKFIEEGRKYVPFERIATLPSGTLDILSEKCMNFESRQSAYEQLLEAVKNNDASMIGLYGMGGCGKTTLAMEVRKLVEAEHLFDKVLFVSISSTVEVRRIQEKIASSLQYAFPETEVMERAQRLCLRLTQEKKILVILDDVWEKVDFGGIGIPSSEHHKGCKILITTRSEEVCTSMDCQRKIYLPTLTDEEAWTLFQNKALIFEDTPDALKHMGRLISNECKGLPVAIAAVASSLKGKSETVWSVALNKLRSSKPINIERGLNDPYKCLQLSYDNLDTKEAKSLFLLCSVFPEDFEIPIELLIKCAIGLGVVGETHSYEEARSEVMATKIKLVSSCLLLDEKEECVKMHDIVRDVAHLIAKNENNIIKCEEEKDVTIEQNSVRYLCCLKFPNDLDCSNLEFLLLHTKVKELDGIFKRMGMLKVLILDNDEDAKTPLPKSSFRTLTNLRYLFISNYELTDLTFVSDMKKLQSLSLVECSLPLFETDVVITQAITLKLLELIRCDVKGKMFEVIKRTPLLEELYIIDTEGEWDANSEDFIEFFNTFSVPQTLQRYKVVLGSDDFDDYNDYEFFSNPRTLLLNHFDIANEVIKGLAKKATSLFVANILEGAKNVIPDIFQIEEGGLDELIKFEIRDSEEIKCLIDTSNHYSEVVTPFSKLHSLRIDGMENLKVLWHCFQPVNGPFENLEKLYLSDCPRLTSLFTYVVARSLVQLKILKISRCDELQHILADDDKTEKSQGEFTTGNPVHIFQNLQKVKICRCRELKHIFSTSIVRNLTQLKVLKIEGCNMLDQIFGDILPLAHHDKKEEPGEIIEEDFEDTEVSVGDIREFISSQIDEQSMKEFIEEEPGSEHNQNEAHSPEIGDVGNESIEEGPAVEGDKTKPLLTGVEDISNGGGVATHVQSGGVDILAKHSKVVEQDDKMNEGMAGITPSQEIQLEEGLNLLDKQEEIHIVSNNNNIDISPDIHTRLGAYKHFVDLDDAQIALLVEAITTYPHLWNACEKFSERFQAWRLKILADMLLFLQKGSGDNVIPQREKDFHKLCEKAIEIGFESSWVDEMRQRVVVRDPKLREEIAQRQMDENPKRSSSVEMVLDSQAVEHGDGPNENCKRTSPSVKTQNVNNNFEEGSNLVDKEGEIVVVSNDRIVTARNEEPKKEFVAKVSTSKIPRTTTSLTNSQPVERPSPSYSNIPLRETHSNALVDKQRISELCLMNQQKPLGEITEIWSNQTETDTAKESEGHPKIIQDFGANDIMSLFAPIVVGKEGEDNLVGNTLVELEKYLKMSLKDIVSSETNNIRLLSALNFLSNLPFKDVTLSDGLKDIIGTMQQEFPSIVCSFKRGFATIEKLAKLEARGNEVTISLGSKISEAKNFYDEAQLKEVVLKEEIKVCEDALSSLEEEKNKCIAETIGYKMELENVRKDNSQMVEDQRKIEQKLFEVTYKWSILCSQYEYNRMTARNPS